MYLFFRIFMETDRFEIRDIETKDIFETFKNEIAARKYYSSMDFNLNVYYELFDKKLNTVILCRKWNLGVNPGVKVQKRNKEY